MKKNTFIALTLIVTLCTLGISGIRFNAVDIYEAYYLLKIESVAITALWLLTLINMMRIYKEVYHLRRTRPTKDLFIEYVTNDEERPIKLEAEGRYIIWLSDKYGFNRYAGLHKLSVDDLTDTTVLFYDLDNQRKVNRIDRKSSHYIINEKLPAKEQS